LQLYVEGLIWKKTDFLAQRTLTLAKPSAGWDLYNTALLLQDKPHQFTPN